MGNIALTYATITFIVQSKVVYGCYVKRQIQQNSWCSHEKLL